MKRLSDMNFNFSYNKLELLHNPDLDINNRNPNKQIILKEMFERNGPPKKIHISFTHCFSNDNPWVYQKALMRAVKVSNHLKIDFLFIGSDEISI